LPSGAEVDILAAALDERRLSATDVRPGSPTLDVSVFDGLAARVDSLATGLQATPSRAVGDTPSPFMLSERFVAVRSDPATTELEPFAAASSPPMSGPGSVLRVDAADQQCWEVHHSGSEVLMLLAGAVEVALGGDGSQPDTQRRQAATLTRQQQTLVVPKATWHRHRATRPGTALLYLTPTGHTTTRSAS
jgi:mannose-6-phosphate isomerase-like protein (cupin superfamily)